MSMKTALFAEWYEPDGATVRQGEPVCRIESDYVAVEIEAESDGILRHRAKPGHDFPAGEVVGLILGAGERMPSATDLASAEAPAAPAAAAVAPPPIAQARPVAPEASPSSHDREIYEPVLLFPRRMTEAVDPAPTEAPLAPAEPAAVAAEPEVEEAEQESAWEPVPGDEQDFETAWRRGPGRVSLPRDFMDAPRRVLPLGRVQVEAARPPEATNEPAKPPVAAEQEAEAVRGPIRLPVAPKQEQEESRAAAEPAREPAEEPVETAVAAEPEPEAPEERATKAGAATTTPQPEPELVASAETPPERRASAAAPSTILNLRATVHMDEALKMREQLTREWSGSGVRPTNEDVVLRAVARAVVEAGLARRHDDHVGLRVLKGPDQAAPIYVFAGGASRPFREAVGDLAALVEESGPGIDHAQCTVTSLEAFGIDDSLPEPGRDQPLAMSMGAIRRLPVVDGERLGQTHVLTLTLAYDARVVGEAAAARLLARVRDLVEAPYALLVA